MNPHRIFILTAALAVAAAAAGQTPATRKPKTAPPAKRAAPAEQKPWRFNAGVSFDGDSNINHEHDATADFGTVPFFGTEYYRRTRSSRFQFIYDLGFHRYVHTEQWNRVSHYARAGWKPRLKGNWDPETIVETSIRGSSEDRDLSNRYTLRQELGYQMTRNSELKFYGAYRRRDYKDNARDSNNPYAGAKFEHRLGGDREWKTEARYELNDTRDDRQRYRRATFETGYAFPLWRKARLDLSATYRPTWYTHRTISSHSKELRMDQRWIGEATYDYALRNNLLLQLGYVYETRSSNDSDKDFDAHLLTVTFRRNW